MLISISGIKNKLRMEIDQLVEYNRVNIFEKKHSENWTKKLVAKVIFASFTGSN